LRLLRSFDGWETVQHPVNLIDPHHRSFIDQVLPQVRAKGLGMLAMKSNAIGAITENHIAPIEECLRFAWSHNIDTLVSGVETVDQLEQNIRTLKTMKKMSEAEMTTVLSRTKKGLTGPGVEKYKRA